LTLPSSWDAAPEVPCNLIPFSGGG